MSPAPPPPGLGNILSQVSTHSKREYTPPPDPFGWEAALRRQAAELEAEWEAAEAQRADEAAARDEELRRIAAFELSHNEGLILFALVELAADPHLTQAPAITVEQWAHHFNIRPTQVTYAFRKLHQFGIPKPPAPVPLDGLSRFLADKLKAEAEEGAADVLEWAVGGPFGGAVSGPKSLFDIQAPYWIAEHFKSQSGGDA